MEKQTIYQAANGCVCADGCQLSCRGNSCKSLSIIGQTLSPISLKHICKSRYSYTFTDTHTHTHDWMTIFCVNIQLVNGGFMAGTLYCNDFIPADVTIVSFFLLGFSFFMLRGSVGVYKYMQQCSKMRRQPLEPFPSLLPSQLTP